MYTQLKRALSRTLMVTVSLGHLLAQGVATARFSGTVTDQSGVVLVGATVQATHLDTRKRWTAVADLKGRFGIADLPIGSYDIRASSPNFEPVERSGVVLTVGANPIVDFNLKVSGASPPRRRRSNEVF